MCYFFETRCILLRQDRYVFLSFVRRLPIGLPQKALAKICIDRLSLTTSRALLVRQNIRSQLLGLSRSKFASHIDAAPPPLLQKAYRYLFRLLPNYCHNNTSKGRMRSLNPNYSTCRGV